MKKSARFLEFDMAVDEKESFRSLIADKKYSVVIPMIQRDYAQGRAEEHEIRSGFLTEIRNYVDSGNRGNNLDFIYGHAENRQLVVLDGQQRLTTLFLLHWYSALIAGEEKYTSFKEWMMAETHSRFSYHTRTSASEFCDALVKFQRRICVIKDGTVKDTCISLVDAAREVAVSGKSLASFIKNEKWFLAHWNEDPTVISMLNMIDALEEFFPMDKYGNLYDALTGLDGEEPVLTFLFMDLERYELTDSLYIKMNSRGRPLTRFENLKVKLLNEYSKSERQSVAVKFDGPWTDIFWHEVVEQNSGNDNFSTEAMDDMWLNFISALVVNYFAASGCDKSDVKDEVKRMISKKAQLEYRNIVEVFRARDNRFLLEDFPKILDMITEKNGESHSLRILLADSFFYDEKNLFKQIISGNLTYWDRLKFHAFYVYLLLHGEKNFGDWMKFISNVIHNTTIDESDEFAKALKTIEEICSATKGDTLGYLISTPAGEIPSRQLNSIQIEEEKLKATLSSLSSEWKDAINEAEKKLEYFSGKTALHYPGYLSFPFEHASVSFQSVGQDSRDGAKLGVFKKTSALLSEIFPSGNGALHEVSLIRALLSKGDYLKRTNNSGTIASLLMNNDRDLSWKRHLGPKQDKPEFVALVRELLPVHVAGKIQDELDSAIDSSSVSGWRKHFIEFPEILTGFKNDREYFLGKERKVQLSDNSVRYVSASDGQMNHYHSEIESLVHYISLKRKAAGGMELGPYSGLRYAQVRDRSTDKFGFYLIHDQKQWAWKRGEMNVWFFCSYKGKGIYDIQISDWDDDRCVPITDVDFLKILGARNYQKNADGIFVLQSVSVDDLADEISSVCGDLKKI